MRSKTRVLTVNYGQIVHALRTEILVSPAAPPQHSVSAAPFRAIWDTGATHTMITRQVIETLDVFPVNIVSLMTADGEKQSQTYLIHLVLQSKAVFPSVEACEGHILGADVLLGMDIISQGDFAVTNAHGRTTYSFRVPSLEHIDFGQPDEPRE